MSHLARYLSSSADDGGGDYHSGPKSGKHRKRHRSGSDTGRLRVVDDDVKVQYGISNISKFNHNNSIANTVMENGDESSDDEQPIVVVDTGGIIPFSSLKTVDDHRRHGLTKSAEAFPDDDRPSGRSRRRLDTPDLSDKDGSDLSPPRQTPKSDNASVINNKIRNNSKNDESNNDSDMDAPRRPVADGSHDRPETGDMQKIVSLGLSKGSDIANRANLLKQSQELSQIDSATMGRGAATIVRDRHGVPVKNPSVRLIVSDKTEKKWGGGRVQAEEMYNRLIREREEGSAPLSRSIDDESLNEHLRKKQHWGDPFAHLASATSDKGIGEKPVYRGPSATPNRFGILPGHRWDGIDRSNGFEREWFQQQASRDAKKFAAYRFATEDL